jgi:hypothetical protein
MTAIQKSDGSFQVQGTRVGKGSPPVTLSDGTQLLTNSMGQLVVDGMPLEVLPAPNGVGVVVADARGKPATAVLNGDGSYSVAGIAVGPSSGPVTLPDGTVVSVGPGSEVVVNGGEAVMPSALPSASLSGVGTSLLDGSASLPTLRATGTRLTSSKSSAQRLDSRPSFIIPLLPLLLLFSHALTL